MPKTPDLRATVAELLQGGHAHATLERALKGLAFPLAGKKPRGATHTAWELVEHIRLGQWDILEFTRDPAHVSPPWPEGYWPAKPAPPSAAAWNKSRAACRADLAAFLALVSDPGCDLLAPLPHDPGKTVLREALLLADHNAYHLGQLVELRKMLGAWG
ncbi:MAG TPA: DinB family protein [Terriglobales bacterium]|nr:DinB family protein [Terriglobales bacterium]